MRLLTQEDLRAVLHGMHSQHSRFKRGLLGLLVTMLLATIAYQHHAVVSYTEKIAVLEAEVAKLKGERDETAASLKALKSMLSVSVSGARMRRPVHLQGDMLISFIGEVNE